MIECSECFTEDIMLYKFIRHNNWYYCSAECLDYRIRLDLLHAWIVVKNHIDLYNNEPFDPDTWGIKTLVGTT